MIKNRRIHNKEYPLIQNIFLIHVKNIIFFSFFICLCFWWKIMIKGTIYLRFMILKKFNIIKINHGTVVLGKTFDRSWSRLSSLPALREQSYRFSFWCPSFRHIRNCGFSPRRNPSPNQTIRKIGCSFSALSLIFSSSVQDLSLQNPSDYRFDCSFDCETFPHCFSSFFQRSRILAIGRHYWRIHLSLGCWELLWKQKMQCSKTNPS